jgi:L-lactate permease
MHECSAFKASEQTEIPRARDQQPLLVTTALLLRRSAPIQTVVDISDMKTTNSMRVRASRFLSDRYAHRAQPDYLSELVAFAIIVVIAIWPVFLLANAMATTLR